MSTLTEIETAAAALAPAEKEALLRFLAMRLRNERTMQQPRIYSAGELSSMLAEDEADETTFRQNRRGFFWIAV